MDLAKLSFNVDTSKLDEAIQKVGQLEQAVVDLGNKTAPALKNFTKGNDSAADSTEKVNTALKKQAEVGPKASKFYDAQAKGAGEAAKAQELLAKTIESLRFKSSALTEGFKSSEASILSALRLAGNSDTALEPVKELLRTINSQTGKNPFDDSLGGIRRLQEEVVKFKSQMKALQSGEAFNADQFKDIQRIIASINAEGKILELTQGQIDKKIEDTIQDYNTLLAQRNAEKKLVDDLLVKNDKQLKQAERQVAIEARIAKEKEKQSIIRTSAGAFSISEADAIATAKLTTGTEDLTRKLIQAEKETKALAEGFKGVGGAGAKGANQAKVELEKLSKQLEDTKRKAELMKTGLSATTAQGVVRIERLQGTEADIATYVKYRDEIEKINKANQRAGDSFRGLQGAIRQFLPTFGALGAAAVGAAGTVAFIKTADSMALLKSRLKLVSEEGQNTQKTFENLVELANENRTGIEPVITAYTRLVPALKQFGFESGAVKDVTDAFGKTLLISGANTREAESAILQFTQAMASGKLAGDEFRSVSEAAPEFLRQFSEATKIPAGSLKELAAQGLLTSQVIADALLVSKENLAKMAAGLDLTVGQALERLFNRLKSGIAEFDEATGTTKGLAAAIVSLADSVKPAVKNLIEFVKETKAFYQENKQTIDTVVSLTTNIYLTQKAFFGLQALLKGWPAVAATYAGAKAVMITATRTLEGSLYSSAAATVVLKTALRGLLLASGIGAIAVGIGYLTEKLLANNEASNALVKKQEEVKKATGASAEQIEKSKQRNEEFGKQNATVVEGLSDLLDKNKELKVQLSLVGKSVEFQAQARRDLAEAQALNVEGQALLILSSKELKEEEERIALGLLDKATALRENAKLTYQLAVATDANKQATSKTKSEYQKFMESVDSSRKKLLGLNEVETESQKLTTELNKIRKTLTKSQIEAAEAAIKKTAAMEASNKAEKAAIDLGDELGKIMKQGSEASANQVSELEKTVIALELQNEQYGLTEVQIARNTLAQYQNQVAMGKTGDDIARLIELQKRYVAGLEVRASQEATTKAVDEQKKAYDKMFDDLAKGLTDSIFRGFENGKSFIENFKDAIRNAFKTFVVKFLVEPQTDLLKNALQGNGDLVGSLGGLASSFAAGSLGGTTGLGLSSLSGLTTGSFEKLGESLITSNFGAVSEFGKSLFKYAGDLSSFAKTIGPYAGSIAQILQGDVKGAVGSAAGTYAGAALGNALLPGIGGAIGSAIGSLIGDKLVGGLFGGNKVSAQDLSEQQVQPIKDAIYSGFAETLKSLGGTGSVLFNVSGNTGRQGQNPNFAIRGTGFSTNDVVGGVGEVALNEANIAEQVTRAIFAGLRESDFADNIDALFDSINPVTASIKELNAALNFAAQINGVNEGFKKIALEGLRELSGASTEVLGKFFNLVGGLEGFQEKLAFFYNEFTSETEKFTDLTASVKGVLEANNGSLFASRQQFKEYFKALGPDAFAAVSAALGAIDQYYDRIEQGAEQTEQATKSVDDLLAEFKATKRTNDDVARSLISLQDELFNLTATEEQKLQKQKEGLTQQELIIFDQISALKTQKEEQQKINDLAQKAAENEKARLERLLGFGKSISEYLRSLNIKEPTLTPLQKLQGSTSEFDRLIKLAKAGDEDALQKITSSSDDLLNAARDFYGSSQPFQDVLAKVKSSLGDLPAVKTYEQKVLETLQGIKDSVSILSQGVLDGYNEIVSNFQVFDTSLDGLLTFEELQVGLKGKSTDAEIKFLITSLDQNISGNLNELEVALGQFLGEKGAIKTAISNGFGALDLNSDNGLTFDELKLGLKGIATDSSLKMIFTELDTNGDGVISQLEALNGKSASLAGAIKLGLDPLFSKLDTSVNGLISPEEFSAAFGSFGLGSKIDLLRGAFDFNNDKQISKLEALIAKTSEGSTLAVTAINNGFGRLDTTANGLLDFNELKSGLDQFLRDDDIVFLLDLIDKDGDRQISKIEAGNARLNVLAAEIKGNLNPLFDALKISSDAGLTKAQFAEAFASFGLGSKLDGIFREVDVNGDGTISRLEASNASIVRGNLTSEQILNRLNQDSILSYSKAEVAAAYTHGGKFLSHWLADIAYFTQLTAGYTFETKSRIGGAAAGFTLAENTRFILERLYGVLTVASLNREGPSYATFAKGGAFTNTIVNTPTPFSMGLMGEAGPEAIMPLSKGSDGSLGVRVVGGMPSNESVVQQLEISNRNQQALINLQQAANKQIIEKLSEMENRLEGLETSARLEATK